MFGIYEGLTNLFWGKPAKKDNTGKKQKVDFSLEACKEVFKTKECQKIYEVLKSQQSQVVSKDVRRNAEEVVPDSQCELKNQTVTSTTSNTKCEDVEKEVEVQVEVTEKLTKGESRPITEGEKVGIQAIKYNHVDLGGNNILVETGFDSEYVLQSYITGLGLDKNKILGHVKDKAQTVMSNTTEVNDYIAHIMSNYTNIDEQIQAIASYPMSFGHLPGDYMETSFNSMVIGDFGDGGQVKFETKSAKTSVLFSSLKLPLEPIPGNGKSQVSGTMVQLLPGKGDTEVQNFKDETLQNANSTEKCISQTEGEDNVIQMAHIKACEVMDFLKNNPDATEIESRQAKEGTYFTVHFGEYEQTKNVTRTLNVTVPGLNCNTSTTINQTKNLVETKFEKVNVTQEVEKIVEKLVEKNCTNGNESCSNSSLENRIKDHPEDFIVPPLIVIAVEVMAVALIGGSILTCCVIKKCAKKDNNVQPPNVQPPNVQPPNVQPPNVQPPNADNQELDDLNV